MMLERARAGDDSVMNDLLPIIYEELRRLAHAQRNRLRSHETLNTTAIVHEAFIKMAGRDKASYQNRLHFFRIAARVMRDVVVDYARYKNTAKRGGPEADQSLEEAMVLPEVEAEEVLALNEALKRLEKLDERQARVVELRYFVGLTIEEIADALDISSATVKRDWTTARAWLFREMKRDT